MCQFDQDIGVCIVCPVCEDVHLRYRLHELTDGRSPVRTDSTLLADSRTTQTLGRVRLAV